jgi:hypothetical protein
VVECAEGTLRVLPNIEPGFPLRHRVEKEEARLLILLADAAEGQGDMEPTSPSPWWPGNVGRWYC